MKKNNILRFKVLENFISSSRQYQVKDAKIRTWAKITPEVLYDLMEGISGRYKPKSKQVLNEMAKNKWRILSTAKAGGFGDANRNPDPVLHITIRAKFSYHLRCKENTSGNLYIYEITA